MNIIHSFSPFLPNTTTQNKPNLVSLSKNDPTYINQYNKYDGNRSIFGYRTNQNMYINTQQNTIVPSFLHNYVSKPKLNVDIENELFNITRNNNRCASMKFNTTL
jgi:hypothetical protein